MIFYVFVLVNIVNVRVLVSSICLSSIICSLFQWLVSILKMGDSVYMLFMCNVIVIFMSVDILVGVVVMFLVLCVICERCMGVMVMIEVMIIWDLVIVKIVYWVMCG